MNALVKKGLIAGLAVVAGSLIGAVVDKNLPLKDKTGNPVSLNPLPVQPVTGKPDLKRIGIYAAFAAAGAILLTFVGKLLKINFLKS